MDGRSQNVRNHHDWLNIARVPNRAARSGQQDLNLRQPFDPAHCRSDSFGSRHARNPYSSGTVLTTQDGPLPIISLIGDTLALARDERPARGGHALAITSFPTEAAFIATKDIGVSDAPEYEWCAEPSVRRVLAGNLAGCFSRAIRIARNQCRCPENSAKACNHCISIFLKRSAWKAPHPPAVAPTAAFFVRLNSFA
jgi:hypothetical protein